MPLDSVRYALLAVFVAPSAKAARGSPDVRSNGILGLPYETAPPNISDTSIVYIKIPKCASSTGSGITRRIGSRNGLGGARVGFNYNISDPAAPGVFASHMPLHWLYKELPVVPRWRAFLWTLVREPLERHISHFYYFVKPKINHLNQSYPLQHLSARGSAQVAKLYKPSATDTELIQMYASIDENRRFQSAYLEPAPRSSTAEILGYYDLVGVTDMFDETASLLATRLGLPLIDVLYIPVNMAGMEWSGIMRELASPETLASVRAWGEATNYSRFALDDYKLYRDAAAGVRKAVDTRVLAKYRRLRTVAADSCANDKSALRDCFISFLGCGNSCIDSSVADMHHIYDTIP